MPLPSVGNLSTPLGIAGGNTIGAQAPAAVPTANIPTPSLISGAFAGGQFATPQQPLGSMNQTSSLNLPNSFQQTGNLQTMAPNAPPPTTGAGYAPFTPPNPQVTQALRGIPQGILQQLHSSGLIHPQLMSHVFRAQ
jgi:hypothetical protein